LCKVDGTEPEIILDFSPVSQIGPNELTVLGDIAAAADRKTIKVTLQHVRVDIYKVLKLLKLSSRFCFES
jgi:anti-anti-sigma regulatory factor